MVRRGLGLGLEHEQRRQTESGVHGILGEQRVPTWVRVRIRIRLGSGLELGLGFGEERVPTCKDQV